MDLTRCATSRVRRGRARLSNRRIGLHTMANQESANHTPQTASEQQDTALTPPPFVVEDKSEDSNENMEVVAISDEEEMIGVRQITAAQDSGITNNHLDATPALSRPTNLPVPNARRQNESFTFGLAGRISATELMSSAAVSRGVTCNFNNMNSILNKTRRNNNLRNASSSGTSARSYTHIYGEDLWKSRFKQLREPYSGEICHSPSIQVRKMATRLIKLSRCLQTPNSHDLNCLNCHRIPTKPVTGKCGHTRCMRCTIINRSCPCGTPVSWIPHENTVVREVIKKMMDLVKSSRSSKISKLVKPHIETSPTPDSFKLKICQRRCIPTRGALQYSLPRIPMTAHARYSRAQLFISMGLYTEAAPQLARAAASIEPCSRMARRLLTQAVHIVCQERGERIAWRELSLSIREQSMHSWLEPGDLECVLCTNPYRDPVSTPCGHTFCRCCIERSMYYSRRCALCSSSLERFNLDDTGNNLFFSSLLKCLDVAPLPLEPDIIPIVISYVAFPGMPCPLFIKNVRHWLMVLRVLKSGTRRFGMLSYERDHTLGDYGIILEIRDCVVFKNNQCIVSTIGVSRFKVIERDVRDGCDVARIRLLVDMPPTKEEVRNIHVLTKNIVNRALTWVDSMKIAVREEIETAFGTWPLWQETQEEWWTAPDGPVWLWWLVAILPLKKEGKVHILSTQSLLTRMLAVLRTFEVMNGSIL